MEEPKTVDRSPRRRLTSKERFVVTLLLNEHCAAHDGRAVYEEGWDDDRIAAETGVGKQHVAYLRVTAIGKLRDAHQESAVVTSDLELRVARLEKQFAALISSLGGE